ncbi:MAG: hypothetical protein AAGH92_00990 [Planctomycetota bacterium]
MHGFRRLLGRWIAGPAAACLLTCCVSGCVAPEGPVAGTTRVEPTQKIDVLETAVVVLRDAGYAVDRADYRLGVVTSRPAPVATVFEPWHADRQLQGDAWSATAGNLQRVVRIDFAAPDADETQASGDILRVRVQLERFEVPTRRVINAARGRVFSTLSDVPVTWEDRGIEARYWRPVGRDTAEEQRLQTAIYQRFTHVSP